jgi:hypothetical protein
LLLVSAESLIQYNRDLRMVFGATTYRAHAQMLAAGDQIE